MARQLDWVRFLGALQLAAQRGHANGEAGLLDAFARGFLEQAPRTEALARSAGWRKLARLGRMAEGLFERWDWLELVFEACMVTALLEAAVTILAEIERRREPAEICERERRVAVVMEPILRDRVRGERTVLLGTASSDARVPHLAVGPGQPPWVLAAVASDGAVLAALETVSFEPWARRLELVGLAGLRQVELELAPEAGQGAVEHRVAGGNTWVLDGVQAGLPYRLTIRAGLETLGSGLVVFSAAGQETPQVAREYRTVH